MVSSKQRLVVFSSSGFKNRMNSKYFGLWIPPCHINSTNVCSRHSYSVQTCTAVPNTSDWEFGCMRR